MKRELSREEFKKEYCNKIGMTIRSFDKGFIVMQCSCNSDTCSGWAVVSNNKSNIKRHKSLYKVED